MFLNFLSLINLLNSTIFILQIFCESKFCYLNIVFSKKAYGAYLTNFQQSSKFNVVSTTLFQVQRFLDYVRFNEFIFFIFNHFSKNKVHKIISNFTKKFL